MVSNIMIPVITNATEFSSYIMEKRQGLRIDYDENTFPNTRSEINDRLLAGEASVGKLMNTSWRAVINKEQQTYQPLRGGYSYRRYYHNLYGLKIYNPPVKLLYSPLISVTELIIIYNQAELDLVASSDYEEGIDKDYYIDYINSMIFFLNIRPTYKSPIRVKYSYGHTEDDHGVVIAENDITTVTETVITTTANNLIRKGQYDGKLLKITSGANSGGLYRIKTSDINGNVLTLTLLDGYTLVTDGVIIGDTYEIYSVPYDIKEMIWIYTLLGILIADPTYQHNFTNPFEEPTPQYAQFEWLAGRFNTLLNQRKNTMQLLN